MSIQSEIERIKANIASTYSALSARGATMPAEQNSDNLAETVNTVTGGEGGGTAEGAVLYTEQTLTDEQQKQARTNIGAASEASVDNVADVVEMQSMNFAMCMPGTLVWDGVLGDKSVVELDGIQLVRVSDEAPPYPGDEAYVNLSYCVDQSVVSTFGCYAMAGVIGDGLWAAFPTIGIDPLVVVVTADEVQLGGITLSKGTYFPYLQDEGISIYAVALRVPGYSYADKTVPEVEAPVQSDWNQTDEAALDFIKNKPFGPVYGDTVTFDGDTEGRVNIGGQIYKVSDAVPTLEDLKKGFTIGLNWWETTYSAEKAEEHISVDSSGLMTVGSMVLIVPPEAVGAPIGGDGFVLPEAGTYFIYAPYIPDSHTSLCCTKFQLNGYNGFRNVKKLGAQYVEDTSVILLGYEQYLYPDGGDTSDESQRVTAWELWNYVNSGRTVYIAADASMRDLNLVTKFDFSDWFAGVAYESVRVGYRSETDYFNWYYAAGYTPK